MCVYMCIYLKKSLYICGSDPLRLRPDSFPFHILAPLLTVFVLHPRHDFPAACHGYFSSRARVKSVGNLTLFAKNAYIYRRKRTLRLICANIKVPINLQVGLN